MADDDKPFDLKATRREIERRLRTLRPLAIEYERLTAAHAAITATQPALQASRPRRAPRGANRDAILAAVRAQPGITSAQIAAATAINAPTVYATISQLRRLELLIPDGKGYTLRPNAPHAPTAPNAPERDGSHASAPPPPTRARRQRTPRPAARRSRPARAGANRRSRTRRSTRRIAPNTPPASGGRATSTPAAATTDPSTE